MFDTSVVRAHAFAVPRRTTLLASIFIHSIAVMAAIVLTVASTQLPADPPRQMELYRPVPLPIVPPPPLGHPAAHPAQQQHALPPPRTVAAPPLTAPPGIPDQTPVTADPGPATGPVMTTTSGTESGPIGTPIGVSDGVGDSDRGTGGSAPGPYTPGDGVTEARVVSRVEPGFPPAFTHSVRFAVVKVRCVIGQDGAIHDPEIMTSSFPPFNDSVLSAIRQWKFTPGMMHGRPVDTWFELTVKFEVR